MITEDYDMPGYVLVLKSRVMKCCDNSEQLFQKDSLRQQEFDKFKLTNYAAEVTFDSLFLIIVVSSQNLSEKVPLSFKLRHAKEDRVF